MQYESCAMYESSHLIEKPECDMALILNDNLIVHLPLGPGLCKQGISRDRLHLSKSAAAVHDAGDILIFSRYRVFFLGRRSTSSYLTSQYNSPNM